MIVNCKTELIKTLSEIGYQLSDIIAYNIMLIDGARKIQISGTELSYDLDKLSFDYSNEDNEFQKCFGIVLFTDGSWLERKFFAGSEWWHYRIAPDIHDVINGNYFRYLSNCKQESKRLFP